MTEIDQANGHNHAPANRRAVPVPGPREPQDAVPPGVWRGRYPESDERLTRERTVFAVRVRRVATHPRTRAVAGTVGKGAVRQGAYVLAGGRVVARRTWDSRTTARHHRLMRAAEAAGDHAAVRELAAQAEEHRSARHARRMALLAAPMVAARSLVYGAAALFALGVLLGITSHRLGDVMRPLLDAGEAVRWTLATAAALWQPVSTFGPWAALAGLWAVGKAKAQMPAWLATNAQSAGELVIDERTITLALKALGIKQITAHLKDGLPLQYITPARVDGRGTFAAIRLPAGVPAELVAKKRGALATGLQRAAKEVWPTVGAEAGILSLWVADKGALAEGAGPYPLLTEGSADFFKGFPFGKTLRGTPVIAPVAERNTIVGGMPGQGKSSAARNLVAGAALDPTCELRIWVPDANFDFEAFKPRCSRYVMGAEDEKIAVILRDLEALHEEIQERGRLLVKHGEPAVTRKLADREPKLRPLICLLEEAHVAFNHPVHGKEISRLTVEIVRLGRKRAVHFIVSTQAPTAKSIPRDVTRNCSNGLAFAVADHVANDALLGDGAHRGGHRATELLPGVDKGTCLAKGLTGERSDIVQVHFIDVSKGNDQITPLIKRALAAVEKRNATVLSAPETEAQQVDQLADIAQVLRGERVVKTEEVVHRLKVLRPGYYKDWTTAELKAALKPFGAEPYKTNGTMHVGLERVREAIAERDNENASDETGPAES